VTWGYLTGKRSFAALALLLGVTVHAASVTVGVLGMQDDPRYAQRQLEHHYAGHPGGRALDGVRLAVQESDPELEAMGYKLTVKPYLAANTGDWTRVVAQLRSDKVQHIVLDLPDDALPGALSALRDSRDPLILFNVASGSDSLRGAQCEANLLHTYPSQSMQFDALVQYLAGRSWSQALLLVGPRPADQALQAAFARSAKRYGLKINKTVPFKLSGDPRERDLANVRLLTGDRSHDVVVVLDSDGEFARGVPFNTQWPRPVVGSSGLTPMAWHPQWELNGGPQVSRRFQRLAQRPMEAQDWAAWAAIKALVSVLSDKPKASIPEQLKALRSGQVFLDGFKGPRLSFRPWDGQLRQPVFLGSADGVASVAPFEGVMHPVDVLDTLGFDEKESTCRKHP
jgi:ABC transporter substrate binding protein (PQQ-dependent alcohol dehydrogenase system)